MQDCKEHILEIYLSPIIKKALLKITPADLQSDLKQEMAVILLELPCERIALMHSENKLIGYALMTVYKMAFSNTSAFFYKYRKSDLKKAFEYLQSQIILPTLPINLADKAKVIIEQKKGLYEEHEARIFNKYVELSSCDKVAKYYNIPKHHVKDIVSKVRNEIKSKLQ